MNCPHCYQPVEERSAFCPHCGARLAETDRIVAVEAADDPTYGALAQANLLRLRGDWDGAREKTVEVLRAFPNSGTAHSLLGDIHADQGLYEDAASWYRMALDLEPDNAADARKLAQAEARVREQAMSLEEPPERRPGLSPLVIFGWAAAAFLAIVIALGFWINSQRPPEEPYSMAPPVTRPRLTPNPPATGTAPTPGTPPQAPPGDRNHPAAPGTVTPPVPGLETPSRAPKARAEESLLAAMGPGGQTLATAGLRVADVLVDPRGPSAIVTLDGSRVNGRSTGWMEGIHGAALAAAQATVSADHGLQRVTVRIVMPLQAEEGVIEEVAFIGEYRPARNATGFERRWWHPGLQPPPALATTETTAP